MKQLLISIGIILAMYLIWAFCLNELNPQKWSQDTRVYLSLLTICTVVFYNLAKKDLRF
jgi:xanthine/uracil permease